MPSTLEHSQGPFTVTTNGSGVCQLTPVSPPHSWRLDEVYLHTSAGAAAWGKVVPQTVTIPSVGTFTLLTLTAST